MFTFEYEKDSQYVCLNNNFYDVLSNDFSIDALRKEFFNDGIIGIDINDVEEELILEKFNTICNTDSTFNLIIPDEIKVTVVGFTTSDNFVLINVASSISYSNDINVMKNK